jgi:hypothetical protein
MGRPRTRSARATSVASRMVSQSACRFMETVKWRQEDCSGLGRRCLLEVATKVRMDGRGLTRYEDTGYAFYSLLRKTRGRIAARKIVRALHFGKSPETPRQPVNPDRVSKLFFEHALESYDAQHVLSSARVRHQRSRIPGAPSLPLQGVSFSGTDSTVRSTSGPRSVPAFRRSLVG